MNKNSAPDFDKLTDDVIANYNAFSQTHRIGEMFVPSRSKIVAILNHLQRILFPGFFGQKELTHQEIRGHTHKMLKGLHEELVDQIYHCFCMKRHCEECLDKDACIVIAEDLTDRFLQRLPAIREKLALDAQAGYDGDPAATGIAEVIYCYPGYYAIMVHRLAHELLAIGVPLMPRIMSEYAHSATGTDIHPGAQIGNSFFIDHATGVVIGETTKIGDHVKIYQGVTLGALSFPKDERGKIIRGAKRHPTIEDNVTIYANATILGGDTVIGKGVTVPGNTFVTRSIRADKVVAAKKTETSSKGQAAEPA